MSATRNPIGSWGVVYFVFIVCISFGAPAFSEIAGGVQIDGQPPEPSGTPRTVEAPAGAIVIDFDDVTATCAFVDTFAVREEYASLGVHFSAPGNDGGAILDECANFGVTGHSSPNYLAFNTVASYLNGGVARTPQTITFDFPADYFQINAGAGAGQGDVTLDAYDAADQLLDSDSLFSAAGMQTLSVSGPGITRVVITTDGGWLVLDDLAVGATTVPTMPWWTIALLIVTLAGIAVMALRRRT